MHSRLTHRIERHARAAVVLAAIACVVGCAHSYSSRPAPFRVRIDSTEAGSLEGPFTGRVFDAATKAPIAGAQVYATWTLERGSRFAEPAGFREKLVSTDSTGRYTIPDLAAVIRASKTDVPGGVRVSDFALVVYKRGFVAYRSDRRFSDLGPQLEFAQTDNQIKLERWRSEMSHAKHLRYIGGGGAIAALTAWEADEAATELANRGSGHAVDDFARGGGSGAAPYLVAAQLLTENDIKSRTKYDGGFETGPLGDEPDTAVYSSQHFKALGRPESWDIALRMWRVKSNAAVERYEELIGSLPSVEEKDEVGTRSFRANETDIRGVGFLDVPRGLVVLITCGIKQCSNIDDVVALAPLIHDHIKQITGEVAPVDDSPLLNNATKKPAAAAPATGAKP